MTNPKAHQQTVEEETTFIDILAVIVKKKSLILFIISLFTIFSFIYYFLVTPIYQANISFLPPSQEIYLSKIAPNLLTKTIETKLDKKEITLFGQNTLRSFSCEQIHVPKIVKQCHKFSTKQSCGVRSDFFVQVIKKANIF